MGTYLRAMIVAVVLGGLLPGEAAGAARERILIMGSSTTACSGQLTSATRCYVHLVEAAQPGARFTVLGRGGTYIAHGTDPARNWTRTRIPAGHDRVIVQLGINDWYVPVPPAQLRRDLDRLITRVRAANPGARIAWVRTWMPVPTGDAAARRRMWALHGRTTATALRHAAGATFIDMRTSPGPRRSTNPGDAGWHYNDRGHAELAAAVNDWLSHRGGCSSRARSCSRSG
jgi:lysophospholipase L1-like esterase